MEKSFYKKPLLQNVAGTRSSWDDELIPQLEAKWRVWREESKDLNRIHVPRHLGLSLISISTVHCFVDASIDAIACCFYLLIETENQLSSGLVFSKE